MLSRRANLGAILALYAELGEAARAAPGHRTRERLEHIRTAVPWEHLWPWVFGDLDAADAQEAHARPRARMTCGPCHGKRLWHRAGVREDSTVVFLGDLNNWPAAYGYWLFAAYGIPDVRLLNGGRQLWLAEQRPMTWSGPELPGPGPVPVPQFCPQMRAGRADAARAARAGFLALVRTPQEYSGQWLSEPEYPPRQPSAAATSRAPAQFPGTAPSAWTAG